jgi:hypothetical protein
MSSSDSQQSVRQMDPLENRLLLKSYIQFPKVSGFRWTCSPSSCRAFRSIILRFVSVRGSMVNLLIYLVDQLLRGCQFADNPSRALQNQATKGFPVYGSWLQELEAEVAQIQLYLRISLRHLLSLDHQDLVLGRFWFFYLSDVLQTSDFLGYLQTLFYYPYYFCILELVVCGFYILCLPLSFWDKKGEYFIAVVFLLCLPFVILRQKGEYFCVDRECIFKSIKWFLS